MNPNPLGAAHQFTYDGASINIYHANKGEGLPKHGHTYSHATFCTSGSCYIRVGKDDTEEFKELIIDKSSQPINFPSDKWHEIEAIEDNTVFINVFSEGKM
jgi:quercetin dioxygenase-like cupin family protein